MTAYNLTASAGSETIASSPISYDREMVCAADVLGVSGGAATLLQGETSTTIRWALVAIELEARSKGGTIRLQQEAKK